MGDVLSLVLGEGKVTYYQWVDEASLRSFLESRRLGYYHDTNGNIIKQLSNPMRKCIPGHNLYNEDSVNAIVLLGQNHDVQGSRMES